MSYPIGFTAKQPGQETQELSLVEQRQSSPRRSVVQVYFEDRDRSYAYYNDRFDLHRGDVVYVEGKLEGLRGLVTQVSYRFKIKLSDYKRVIAVADTHVHGTFHMADSHLVTFDRMALPYSKAVTWFKAPLKEEDEVVTVTDDTEFRLDDLENLSINQMTAQHGYEYYIENKVQYISVDGTEGHAIVMGSQAYEVEFTYEDGVVSDMTCSCFCYDICKHQFAVLLQLQKTLELIGERYAEQYAQTGSFAAMHKETLLHFALFLKKNGCITF